MRFAKLLISMVLLFGVAAVGAEAASKKKVSSATISAAQRKKIFENGLISCRKAFGAQLHFVRVENFYGHYGAVCYHY